MKSYKDGAAERWQNFRYSVGMKLTAGAMLAAAALSTYASVHELNVSQRSYAAASADLHNKKLLPSVRYEDNYSDGMNAQNEQGNAIMYGVLGAAVEVAFIAGFESMNNSIKKMRVGMRVLAKPEVVDQQGSPEAALDFGVLADNIIADSYTALDFYRQGVDPGAGFREERHPEDPPGDQGYL